MFSNSKYIAILEVLGEAIEKGITEKVDVVHGEDRYTKHFDAEKTLEYIHNEIVRLKR